jgi:hypothetical protein
MMREFRALIPRAEAQRGAPRGVRRLGRVPLRGLGHTYRFRFTGAMFSRLDYFHPSLLGQATLAAETWRMSWWGA